MNSPMSSLLEQSVRYDLAESTCPPLRVGELGVGELGAGPGLAGLALGYGTVRGDAALRASIAAGAGVEPDQVLVTVGSIEAMALLAEVVCRPGDRVLLAAPHFPPARAVPESLGARVDVVGLSFDDGYRLPVDRVAGALTARTRLVSLASPQNPSGVRFTDGEVHALLDAVGERAPGAVVLVDETYRAATYGSPVPGSAAGWSPRVVTCSSLSKAHGAAGLRIGWLTSTDPALYARLSDAKFRRTIACSAVDEHLAAQVLRQQEPILAERARHLRQGLDEVRRWAAGQPVEIVEPDGGALCCVRIPAAAVPGFHDRLAARDTRVAPGPWFGEDARVFRLGFGHLPISDLTVGLARVSDAVAGAPG